MGLGPSVGSCYLSATWIILFLITIVYAKILAVWSLNLVSAVQCFSVILSKLFFSQQLSPDPCCVWAGPGVSVTMFKCYTDYIIFFSQCVMQRS